MEPETEVENDVDPLGDMDDCLNPSPQPIVDKIKAENSLDDDDEDPFYRTFSTSPPSPKTSRGRTSPTPTITAPPLRYVRICVNMYSDLYNWISINKNKGSNMFCFKYIHKSQLFRFIIYFMQIFVFQKTKEKRFSSSTKNGAA